MKRILFCMALACVSFAFNSCEDVVEPYIVQDPDNGGGGSTEDVVKTLPYEEDFSSSLGDFKNYTTSGSGAWIIDYSTAKASGYDNATQVTTAGTYYLVSPEISLTGVSAAHLTFDYILRYNRGDENQQLFISEAFKTETPAEGWVALPLALTEGSDWSTFYAADVQIPAEYLGKTVRFAFYYNTNATSGSTWEVKNFAIQEGNAGEGGGEEETPDTPDTPVTGNSLIANGDFEGWTDGKPNHWKTTSTAGNATLSQSTDAHSGTYSVCVAGASSNKRLGYEEMNLKAGTYQVKFYAKAATADGASVRPGYATFNADGTINSSGYKYGDYANNLSNSEWTEVNHEFTLDADQKIALVVMNSKNPGKDVLIDDYTIVTANGGVVGGGDGGGGETPDTPEPPVMEGFFSETFESNLGTFTMEDKTLTGELTYVWSHAGSYKCAKASGYKNSACDAESWLVSPSIDLTSATAATLSFAHAGKFFGTPAEEALVMVKEESGDWTALTINDWFTNTDYTFVETSIDLGTYAGKKIQIAFVYKSSTEAAGTWEIKNVVVK